MYGVVCVPSVPDAQVEGLAAASATWTQSARWIRAHHGRIGLARPVIALSALNPVDLGRILLLLNFDISALMGFTGAVFKKFFGSGLGQAVTIAAMAAWLLVPLGLGVRRFGRKNF